MHDQVKTAALENNVLVFILLKKTNFIRQIF
jgi:hypothetical protein